MAKPKAMLPSVSSTGGPPQLEIASQDWDELYLSYGHDPSEQARKEVEEICSDYLIWRKVEIDAQPTRIVSDYFEEIEKAVERFQGVGYGSLFPNDDAGHELNRVFGDELEKQSFMIPGSALQSDDGSPINREENFHATLSQQALMDIAIALSVATKKTRASVNARLDDKTSGWQPGHAFNNWLLKMRNWAQANGFRYGPYQNPAAGDDVPSSLSEFLFSINRKFPEELRDNIASEAALAKRLKRLVSRRGTK